MSICPVPSRVRQTDYTDPGSFVADPPDAKFELCVGGTTSIITPPAEIVTQIVCCPSPGPQGPLGCSLKFESDWVTATDYEYLSGAPCYTSLVTHNSKVYIAKQEHTSDASSEPGVGGSWMTYWDEFATSGAMVWKGDWFAGEDYVVNDTVRSGDLTAADGNGYVCITNHTSTADNWPGQGDGSWVAYWEPITDVGLTAVEKSFFDELIDGVFDWMKNATIGDWLLALAVGAGIIWAGSKILDMMSEDGTGDGFADSRFTGTAGFNGAYTAPTLPVVVASLMEMAGFTGAEYDVTLLPATEVNFTISATTAIRDIIRQMSLTYQFDIVPSGGVVRFVPKYQAPVRTLTTDDLGHVQMDDTTLTAQAPYTAKRRQGIELPRSVTFTYFSKDMDHNVFTQVSTLETFTEGQDVKITVPFSITDAEAKRISETALVNSHIEQQEILFVSDYNNMDLEPADIITFPLDSGGTIQLRVMELNEREDGLIEFTCTRSDFNTSSYVASGVPTTAPPTQVNAPVSIGYSQTLFVEVPPLSNTETLPRLGMIIHGYGKAGWPGAAVYQSVDGGTSYTQKIISNNNPTFGIVASTTPTPPSGNYYVWDDTTTISVVVKQGTLLTKTDAAILNGENQCMVGQEVMSFVTATLTAPNTYTLSRLLRGRAGSEVHTGDHVANELFVMLDDQMQYLVYPVNEIGQVTKFKTITIGSDLSKVAADDVQTYAVNMRPWRVAQPTATLVSTDWVINWVERPRLDNTLRDYTEINHDVDFAGYALAIMDGAIVKRTVLTTIDTYTYTEAQQIADFGSPQGTLEVSIVQMSQLVGGGYPYVVTA